MWPLVDKDFPAEFLILNDRSVKILRIYVQIPFCSHHRLASKICPVSSWCRIRVSSRGRGLFKVWPSVVSLLALPMWAQYSPVFYGCWFFVDTIVLIHKSQSNLFNNLLYWLFVANNQEEGLARRSVATTLPSLGPIVCQVSNQPLHIPRTMNSRRNLRRILEAFRKGLANGHTDGNTLAQCS